MQYYKKGVSLLGIARAAEAIGFRTVGVRITYDQLLKQAIFPAVLHWEQNHFVVIYKIKRRKKGDIIYISDPDKGNIRYKEKEFKKAWLSTLYDGNSVGVSLFIEPTATFYEKKDNRIKRPVINVLWDYLKPHKKLAFQLILVLLASAGLQFIFPYLTQSVVDIGINNKDINFIKAVLPAQLMLYLGFTISDLIRNRLLLHISTRINISLLSDFF